MKLSDALKFSHDRRAQHPTRDGFPIEADDVGIRCEISDVHSSRTQWVAEAWTEMHHEVRKLLLASEKWEPLDPKPIMLILAESTCDWSIHENQSHGDEEGQPDEIDNQPL